MELHISLSHNENIDKQTTVFHVEFSHEDLVKIGTPPRDLWLTAGGVTHVFNPHLNPSACNTVEYKLLTLAWQCMVANNPQAHSRGVIGNGDVPDFLKGQGGFDERQRG